MTLDSRQLGTLQELANRAENGTLGDASLRDLDLYSAALGHSMASTVFTRQEHFPQVCEAVRTNLIRSHITALNEKNAFTQRLVIVLTVASIIGSAIQIWYAAKADERETAQASIVAAQPRPTQLPASAPTPAKPPSNHPTSSREVGGKESNKGKPAS